VSCPPFEASWTDLAGRRTPTPLVIEHFEVIEQLHLCVPVRVEPVGEFTLDVEKKLPITALSQSLVRRLVLKTMP
jgi:hypothetical protein